MKQFFKDFLLFVAFSFVGFFLILIGVSIGGFFSTEQLNSHVLKKNSVLLLKLRGIILGENEVIQKFLEDLRIYSEKDEIHGVIVLVDSPGGTVGKSQEIYSALKRVKEEFQKPVVALCEDITASGGYYSILGVSRILTHPGTLMGSIGVVSHFINLKDFYSWIRVEPYTIKSGSYKDVGNSLRAMTEKEKLFFQNLLQRVHLQFKTAVEENRKSIFKDVLEKYTEGQIFTGETAVKLGFADQLGTYEEAIQLMEELTGLKEKINVFIPPPKKKSFVETLFTTVSATQFLRSKLFSSMESLGAFSMEGVGTALLDKKHILGKPLYIMPGIY